MSKLKSFLNNTNILVILFLFFAAFAFIFHLAASPNEEIKLLIRLIDNGMCIGIVCYFFSQWRKAPVKYKFFAKRGWFILLAAIPTFGIFGTIEPYVRLLRFWLVMDLSNKQKLGSNGKQHEIWISILTGVLIICISSILILFFETAPESNIKTAGDAIYWAIVTISTVGYGDLYPVTTGGRIVAVVLLFSGVSLFVTLAGYFSAWINRSNQKEEKE